MGVFKSPEKIVQKSCRASSEAVLPAVCLREKETRGDGVVSMFTRTRALPWCVEGRCVKILVIRMKGKHFLKDKHSDRCLPTQ